MAPVGQVASAGTLADGVAEVGLAPTATKVRGAVLAGATTVAGGVPPVAGAGVVRAETGYLLVAGVRPPDEGLVPGSRLTLAREAMATTTPTYAAVTGVATTAAVACPTTRRRPIAGTRVIATGAPERRPGVLPAVRLGAAGAVSRVLPT